MMLRIKCLVISFVFLIPMALAQPAPPDSGNLAPVNPGLIVLLLSAAYGLHLKRKESESD